MTPKEWVERINVVMELQKVLCEETMSMRFTRRELAELKMICGVVAEMGENNDK